MFEPVAINDVVMFEIKQKRATADIAHEFKDFLTDLIDKENAKKVVVDFSHVVFIDSFFLGALVSCTKKIRLKEGDIRLANLNQSITPIFNLMHLTDVFKMFQSKDEAVLSFKDSAG